MKPFSPSSEVVPKQTAGRLPPDKTRGFGHVSRHPQFDLSPFPQGCHRWHGSDPGEPPMTEVVAALLAFLSIGIFLAHAFDAFRTR